MADDDGSFNLEQFARPRGNDDSNDGSRLSLPRDSRRVSLGASEPATTEMLPPPTDTRRRRMRMKLPTSGMNWQHKLLQWRLGVGNYAETVSGETDSVNASDLHIAPTETGSIIQRPTGAESGLSIPFGAPSVISGEEPAEQANNDGFDDDFGGEPDYGDYDGGDLGGEPDYGQDQNEMNRLREERDQAVERRLELERDLQREQGMGLGQVFAQPAQPEEEHSESDDDMRPREPLEQPKPIIYRVDVDELPELDFDEGDSVHSEDLMSEGSEDDEPEMSDAGSIADMIVQDSEGDEDADASFDEVDAQRAESDSDDSSTDLFLAEDEDSDNDWRPSDETFAELDDLPNDRNERPKRHRIPALKFWNNERVEYDLEGKLFLPTAVDVVLVDEPEPRRRRRRRRRPRGDVVLADESEVLEHQEVQAPVYDIRKHRSQFETVARSIRGMAFRSLPDNPRVQVVVLFDQPDTVPIESLVMKIQPNGAVAYDDFQNHAVTFVVWTGRLEVIINGKEFELTRGMACKVPRGNDLSISNIGTTDAFLLVTEINITTEDGDDVVLDTSSQAPEQASIWSGPSFGGNRSDVTERTERTDRTERSSWRELNPN